MLGTVGLEGRAALPSWSLSEQPSKCEDDHQHLVSDDAPISTLSRQMGKQRLWEEDAALCGTAVGL